MAIGGIYYWGQGAAIDYPRAMTAYKIAAEAGDALGQYQVAHMYCDGLGVDMDFKLALAWLKKAVAQDHPEAIDLLGDLHFIGRGVPPSYRRARQHYESAIELGCSEAVLSMQRFTRNVAEVTSRRTSLFNISTAFVRT